MKLIIDTNIVFSALLGNKKAQNLIFFDELITPKMMLLEIFKYKEKIKKFSKDDIDILFFDLAKNIKIIDEDYIPFEF
ncbi:MAG: DNA-binding protein, partial [Nautilia sp.]